MTIPMWYKNRFTKGKYNADVFFTPCNVYVGYIYNDKGKAIGDYHTEDSTEIEAHFICSLRYYIETWESEQPIADFSRESERQAWVDSNCYATDIATYLNGTTTKISFYEM